MGTKSKKISPTRTPEARENQLVNLAMATAEEKLLNGTASNQLIIHFLKLGTAKAEYEREKLKADTELARAKADQVAAQMKYDEVAAKALEAFKSYTGSFEEYDEDDFYE